MRALPRAAASSCRKPDREAECGLRARPCRWPGHEGFANRGAVRAESEKKAISFLTISSAQLEPVGFRDRVVDAHAVAQEDQHPLAVVIVFKAADGAGQTALQIGVSQGDFLLQALERLLDAG